RPRSPRPPFRGGGARGGAGPPLSRHDWPVITAGAHQAKGRELTMTRTALLVTSALLAAAPASAQEMPSRKAGLWELAMSFGTPGRAPQTMQQCIDAATDQTLHSSAGAAGQQDCSKRDINKTATGMTIDSVCTRAGKTITSPTEVTGSFDSSYTMKITTETAGPRQPGELGSITMTMQAKWLGPCKADMKPGDMIMPGGVKINVQDIQRMRPGGALGVVPPSLPQR